MRQTLAKFWKTSAVRRQGRIVEKVYSDPDTAPPSKAAAGNCRPPARPSANSRNPPTSSHPAATSKAPWASPGTASGAASKPTLPSRRLVQRTLDAMLRRQSLELHRHRPDRRHPVLVPRLRHRRRRSQRLGRPRRQTGDLSAAWGCGKHGGAGLWLARPPPPTGQSFADIRILPHFQERNPGLQRVPGFASIRTTGKIRM